MAGITIVMSKTVVLTYPTWVPTNTLSVLLTNSTTECTSNLYHTSLGDISPRYLIEFVIANKIDVVEFVDDPVKYETNSIYYETKKLARYFGAKEISNVKISPNYFLTNNVTTRPAEPTLWTFGCSLTYGIGVTTQDGYPHLLSKELNLPLKNVSLPGSSTRWSLRHLMNSTISKLDTVIWQITTMERFSIIKNNSVNEVMLKYSSDKNWVLTQTDEQMMFDQLSLLNYGVRFLRSIGCRFLIISLDSTNDLSNYLTDQYIAYREYVYVPEWIVDRGNDNQHPGKLSHRILAQHIIKTLQYTNE